MNRTQKTLPMFLAALLIGAFPALACLMSEPPYDQLTKNSDVIVIALPTATKELQEKASIPGFQQDGKPIPAISIETTFEIIAVLKGQLQGKFTLLHYREENPPAISTCPIPLIAFTSSEHMQYLMFLKKRGDGRYEPQDPNSPSYCITPLRKDILRTMIESMKANRGEKVK